ncbi:MAG: hypothetical protein AB7I33_00215 [Gemmatimonadales bacterium]
MKVQKIFCSGCDREVRVVLTAEPVHEGHANLPDSELVCLEIGDRCTGSLCPVFALPPEEMKARLARSGFDTTGLKHVRAHCDGCDRETDMVVLNREYWHCTECNTINRWRLHDAPAPTDG